MFHQLGFYAAVALSLPLVLTADHGPARIAAIVTGEHLSQEEIGRIAAERDMIIID